MKKGLWLIMIMMMPCLATAEGLEAIRYRPPPAGDEADVTRLQWESPHHDEGAVHLTALVPSLGGRTTQGQPNLYWHLSAPVIHGRMEVSLTGEEDAEPLVENSIIVDAGGVKRLSLTELGVALEPEKDYEWLVVLVVDGADRKRDVISGGTLRWEPVDRELAILLHSATLEQLPLIHAEEGYWFDAVDSLWQLVEKNPDNEHYRRAWQTLLGQEGLAEAARPLPASPLGSLLK